MYQFEFPGEGARFLSRQMWINKSYTVTPAGIYVHKHVLFRNVTNIYPIFIFPRQAVCCEDKMHCCPEDTKCDIVHSKCLSPTLESFPMFEKLPARRTEAKHNQPGNTICVWHHQCILSVKCIYVCVRILMRWCVCSRTNLSLCNLVSISVYILCCSMPFSCLGLCVL